VNRVQPCHFIGTEGGSACQYGGEPLHVARAALQVGEQTVQAIRIWCSMPDEPVVRGDNGRHRFGFVSQIPKLVKVLDDLVEKDRLAI